MDTDDVVFVADFRDIALNIGRIVEMRFQPVLIDAFRARSSPPLASPPELCRPIRCLKFERRSTMSTESGSDPSTRESIKVGPLLFISGYGASIEFWPPVSALAYLLSWNLFAQTMANDAMPNLDHYTRFPLKSFTKLAEWPMRKLSE